ncbi:MAG TPA: response regulator [Blastocatellia bacterium]|nr:response regulator [Blastocatellia bacterium]
MTTGEILIVDDTPENLDLLIDILEQHGLAVRVAGTGRRALAAVEASPPDLIMLDINMPGMNGFEVCRSLKADAKSRDIPVVFLSVHDDVREKVAAFKAGGSDYITKPFQAEEVLVRVENQLKIARLQRELTVKGEEALEASRAKSAFLANMSHELRTPLNGILGFVQLLESDNSLSAEQRDRLAVISRSGEHLLGLINDVLSLSKMEAGQAVVHDRPFSLRRMLLGLEEMFRVRAESQGLSFSVEMTPEVPDRVTGDDGKLRQILINLLGNAFKFTTAGSVELRVSWGDGVGYFEVEDTGPGVPVDQRNRIFEPFVQTALGKRSGEGTGLGLTISRNYARLMDGDLQAGGEVGRGATFRCHVALPRDGHAEAPDTVVAQVGHERRPRVGHERIAAVSPDALQQLRVAVIAGDREAALSATGDIARTDPALAETLHEMVRTYRFDDVLDLLQGDPPAETT